MDKEGEMQNYWESTPATNKPKKKKVSFDDILSNMNLVVNKQGVLQMMAPNHQLSQQMQKGDFSYQDDHQIQQGQVPQQQPVEPAVKHSYIYNKYFKDYNDVNSGPTVRVPKTMEEYKQMLEEDRMKRQMIAQVKSTKMFFTANSNTGSNPRDIRASTGGLRKMTFN